MHAGVRTFIQLMPDDEVAAKQFRAYEHIVREFVAAAAVSANGTATPASASASTSGGVRFFYLPIPDTQSTSDEKLMELLDLITSAHAPSSGVGWHDATDFRISRRTHSARSCTKRESFNRAVIAKNPTSPVFKRRSQWHNRQKMCVRPMGTAKKDPTSTRRKLRMVVVQRSLCSPQVGILCC